MELQSSRSEQLFREQLSLLSLKESQQRERSLAVMALATLAAVTLIAVMAVQTRRLSSRAEYLRTEALQQAQRASQARSAAERAEAQAETLRKEISNLREALGASRMAIAAFHQGDYSTALKYYDAALQADPGNAYLLNLRAYALFKQHRYEEAIAAETLSTKADPAYAWGYFDLARFQCAVGKRGDARQSIKKALELRPDLRSIVQQDGEFRRLCGEIVPSAAGP